jgi:hypothetical protein
MYILVKIVIEIYYFGCFMLCVIKYIILAEFTMYNGLSFGKQFHCLFNNHG